MNYLEKNSAILEAIQIANTGNLVEAKSRLEKILIEEPKNNFLLINLATLNVFTRNFAGALNNLNQFLDNNETHFCDFYIKATAMYSEISQYSLAIRCAEQLVANFPQNLSAKILLSETCYSSRDIDKAIKIAENILTIDPEKNITKVFLGNAYSGKGDFVAAEKLFMEVLKSSPFDSFACHGLSKCRSFKDDAENYLPLLEMALNTDHSIEEEARIRFAMAKLYNDSCDYDRAWLQADKATNLQATIMPFNENQYISYVDELIQVFSNNTDVCASHSDTPPILIIGMPRSGTTLTEQILSNGLCIYPGGEKQGIDYAILQGIGSKDLLRSMDTLKQKTLDLMAKEYLEYFHRFANYKGGTIVDKVPSNYLFLGLFKMMFSNVKIINLQRNPLDVTASIFFENFTYKLNYTNKVEHILCVYQQYRRLMNFWQEQFSENILTIEYEKMVENYEHYQQKIINFCDIDMDKSKHFQESSNLVETPSSWQVRQGIYKTSKNRWRRYEKYLKPYENKIK